MVDISLQNGCLGQTLRHDVCQSLQLCVTICFHGSLVRVNNTQDLYDYAAFINIQ